MGFSSLADPRRFVSVFGWMALSWVLAVFVHYFVLKAYAPEAQVLWAAFALGVAALGVAIPSSPGAIGVYEAAFRCSPGFGRCAFFASTSLCHHNTCDVLHRHRNSRRLCALSRG